MMASLLSDDDVAVDCSLEFRLMNKNRAVPQPLLAVQEAAPPLAVQ